MSEPAKTEKATRLAHSLHVTRVKDVDHWPVAVTDGRYGDGPSVSCNALAARNFGSGEKLAVPCLAELDGSCLAELRESITRHLQHTEHAADPLNQPEKAFFTVEQNEAPQVPSPPEYPESEA